MLNKIKRSLVLLIILLAGYGAIAQVIEAEYYIDTDPGEGSGIAMVAEDGALDNVIESVLKDGISFGSPGIHVIGIRVKNDSLHWGPVFKTIVSVENTLAAVNKNVSLAEFYWDTDPGEGSGTALLAFDGNFNDALETIFQSGITLPATGIHKFCVRVQDVDNNWGPVFTTVMSVENVTSIPDVHITAGELFWDSDPGEGSGTALIAFDGAFDEAIETATQSLALPATGMHTLSVRVQDMYNNWGPVFTTVVSVENMLVPPSISVFAGELFWDTDPGEGSGTALIAFDGNFDNAIETAMQNSISMPAAGLHTLSVRVRDENLTWGPIFTTVISIEELGTTRPFYVASGEMFWDNDPGEGSGTALIAFDGSFSDAIEQVMGSGIAIPSQGIHTLNVRVLDADNNWGAVFTTVVSIEDPFTIPDISVIEAEAYWDTDPGEGSGIPIIAFDGNFDNAFEELSQSLVTGSLAEGHHTLNVRVLDAKNNWGPVYTNVVFVDPCASNPEPTLAANGPTTICYGDSLELIAETGFVTYSWILGGADIGETTESIYVTEPGYYKVIVTDGNGCPGVSDAVILDVNPLNPTITIIGDTVLCEGSSMTLDAGGPYATYNWSDGSTSSSIIVTTGDTYDVTITDNGCTKTTEAVDVVVNPVPTIPSITEGGSTAFCQGDSVVLTSSAASQYLWSTGDTTQSIAAYFSGNYTVSAINSFGCSTSSFATAVTVTSPSATITANGSNNLCQGETVTLDAGSGYTEYLWSTGDVTQMISTDTAGTYTVTATNVACVGVSDPFVVSVYPLPAAPNITAGGPTTFCPGDSVLLTSSSSTDNVWSTGAVTESIYAYSAGGYSVTVSNGFGCSATSIAEVVDVTTLDATLTVTGPTTICEGDTTIISAVGGYTYEWSTGSTASFINVSDNGSYYATITNGGCSVVSQSIQIAVSAQPTLPAITYTGNTDICDGESLELVSSVSDSYLWSTGATTQSITVTGNGSYFVNVYNTAGCANTSDPVTVTVYSNPKPDILYTGNTALCDGDSLVLTSSATGSNLWSTGATTQLITAYNSGDYFVIADNGGGCTSTSDTLSITVTPLNPVISTNDSTAFCQGGNTILDAGAGYDSYYWSNGQTSQTIDVSQADDYIVTVTQSGCSRPSPAMTITVYSLPAQPVISALDTTAFCNGDSVILESSAAFEYLWSNGETTQNTTISASGCYSVMITDTNSCVSTSTCTNVTVIAPPAIPIISASGPVDFCGGDSVILTSSLNDVYSWSSGEDTRDITVNSAGSYNVTVYNADGCSAVSQYAVVNVFGAQNPPVISYTGSTTFCDGDSVTLTSTSADGYLWATGDTVQNITVTAAGSYFVEVTNSDGCTAMSEMVNVTVNALPGIPAISVNTPLEFCDGDSVIMSSTLAYSYLWSDGDTVSSIVAYTTGNYNVTVYNQYGCEATSSDLYVTVYPNPDPPTITLSDGDTLYTDPAETYQWYFDSLPIANADTICVKAPASGSYMVEITDINGCYASSEVYVFTFIEEAFVADYNIRTYPNPFTEYVIFELTLPEHNREVSFEMYDLTGKLVRSVESIRDSSFRVDRDGLATGTYVFRLFNNEQQQFATGRLVVQ